MTRRSDTVTEQERSHAVATRPRPSHALKKSVRTTAAAYQARRY